MAPPIVNLCCAVGLLAPFATTALTAELGSNNTCQNVTAVPDVLSLGLGQCVDQQGRTSTAFMCVDDACPFISNADSCALLCTADPGCTGFDLRQSSVTSSSTNTPSLTCAIFTAQAPSPPEYWVEVNGTQPSNGRIVVNAGGISNSTCCYKRAYPRPNPDNNPVPPPPIQSDVQKGIFAERTVYAEAASLNATPAVLELIEYCSVNATYGDGSPFFMFNATNCPGMASDSRHATASPTAQDVLARFAAEVRAAECVRTFYCVADDASQVFVD